MMVPSVSAKISGSQGPNKRRSQAPSSSRSDIGIATSLGRSRRVAQTFVDPVEAVEEDRARPRAQSPAIAKPRARTLAGSRSGATRVDAKRGTIDRAQSPVIATGWLVRRFSPLRASELEQSARSRRPPSYPRLRGKTLVPSVRCRAIASEIAEELLQPTENGRVLHDRRYRRRAAQGSLDGLDATEQVLAKRGDESGQSGISLRAREQSKGLLFEPRDPPPRGVQEVILSRPFGLARQLAGAFASWSASLPVRRPLPAGVATPRTAPSSPASRLCGCLRLAAFFASRRSRRRSRHRLQERVEDVDQQRDLADVLSHPIRHGRSAPPSHVDDPPWLERTSDRAWREGRRE